MLGINGIVNIYKPTGITCADLVNVFKKHFRISKVGYAGTLDMFAEGVLPVLLNKATKISKFIEANDKEYLAEVQLGLATDTGDLTGQPVHQDPGFVLNRTDLEKVLKTFIGTIRQLPPEYSAIKINGKRASDLVRQGIKVKVPYRFIKIYEINLLTLDEARKTFTMNVKCSKGTYIRALARDIGKKLHTGGSLNKLVRRRNGLFTAEDAMTMEEFRKIDDLNRLKIYSMNEVLKHYPALIIKNTYIDYIRNGKKLNKFHFLDFGDNLINGIYKISDKDENLLAVVEHKNGKFFYLKVFHNDED
ncbi:MAG: tRNA pseudouridine(55) synthase TruB [bacterium]|nr:tRNA pseudouridine(55) synthase TruB [bacterium]